MTSILPYQRAHEIEDDGNHEPSWLVESLWGEGAVGIVGGEPKCKKSFFALDVAVAVSSGTLCLDRFQVKRGRVLVYAAEDAKETVKKRLSGIAAARGVALSDCEIEIITVERLRLDQKEDMASLAMTVAAVKPILLILDPFVRLHRIDENSSSEVSGILDNLRVMQRQFGTAIMVVHHAKKNGGNARAGQSLRGSSEFHAWLDSMVYMRHTSKKDLILSVEHRSAAAIAPLSVELRSEGVKLALAIQEASTEKSNAVASRSSSSPSERIVEFLSEHDAPVTMADLREAARVRTATFYQALKQLTEAGQIEKRDGGLYVLPRQ